MDNRLELKKERYEITMKSINPISNEYEIETFWACVNWFEEREEDGKKFLYFGYNPLTPGRGTFGCARFYGEKPEPYGVQKMVELVYNNETYSWELPSIYC